MILCLPNLQDPETLGMARSSFLNHLLKHGGIPCPNELQVKKYEFLDVK